MCVRKLRRRLALFLVRLGRRGQLGRCYRLARGRLNLGQLLLTRVLYAPHRHDRQKQRGNRQPTHSHRGPPVSPLARLGPRARLGIRAWLGSGRRFVLRQPIEELRGAGRRAGVRVGVGTGGGAPPAVYARPAPAARQIGPQGERPRALPRRPALETATPAPWPAFG